MNALPDNPLPNLLVLLPGEEVGGPSHGNAIGIMTRIDHDPRDGETYADRMREYYKLRAADLLSRRRTRTIARPRQIAMTLAKNLTNHSLPEIGEAFGGIVASGAHRVKDHIHHVPGTGGDGHIGD